METCVWCQILSTRCHRYCAGHCDCPCRLTNSHPPSAGRWSRPRPHSYPRPDWRHRLPAGTTRRREAFERSARAV